jgi:formylglycine-generating enzyme required for sulfatase activity
VSSADRCCTPGRGNAGESDAAPVAVPPSLAADGSLPSTLVDLAGGPFLMGDDSVWAYPDDGEGPVHEVIVPPLRVDAFAVSNARFAEFVDATGHRTTAERYGWSFVFGGFLPDDFPDTRAVSNAPWWRQVYGADWLHPEGPQSDLDRRLEHPVVHVSWNDASAYCQWRGARLPTEAEWEYAARGGVARTAFPWGDDLEPGGEHRMNVFQGTFPAMNTGADGFLGTAPIDAFSPNGFGLYNVTGNVWEWCADWYDATYYATSPRDDPRGPDRGTNRVMRGGSYLCHLSYCKRYRVSARSGIEPESTTGNLGFRVVADTSTGTRRP